MQFYRTTADARTVAAAFGIDLAAIHREGATSIIPSATDAGTVIDTIGIYLSAVHGNEDTITQISSANAGSIVTTIGFHMAAINIHNTDCNYFILVCISYVRNYSSTDIIYSF